MSPVSDAVEIVACPTCSAPVVSADVLDGPPRDKGRHEVHVDPLPLLPDAGLLLHLGRSSDTGRWLLLALTDDAADKVRRGMRLPHAHRQHVCAAVPAAWLETEKTLTS